MTASNDPHPVVVVGFDGSPASDVALSRAIERVGPDGKLYLVHAWEVPEAWRGRGTYQPYVDRAMTEAEAVIERAVEAHPGLKQTAGAATGAAAVMLAAIIPFAMVDLMSVQVFGVGVAIAVILDALIVRPVLLPAATSLLGRWSWWPLSRQAPPTPPRAATPRGTTDGVRWLPRWRRTA